MSYNQKRILENPDFPRNSLWQACHLLLIIHRSIYRAEGRHSNSKEQRYQLTLCERPVRAGNDSVRVIFGCCGHEIIPFNNDYCFVTHKIQKKWRVIFLVMIKQYAYLRYLYLYIVLYTQRNESREITERIRSGIQSL